MSITRSPIQLEPATSVRSVSEDTKPDLLLIGHGVRGEAAIKATAAHERLADRLRASKQFGMVKWGYLKSDPRLEDVYQDMTSNEVFVLPMLMCDGYFAQKQIPDRLGLPGHRFKQGKREISSCRPLGLQRNLPEVSRKELQNTCDSNDLVAEDIQVVVVGHGSANGSASHDAICAHVDALRCSTNYKAIHAAFLEESPSLPELLAELKGPLLIVGFFASEGVHAQNDIPEQIGDRPDTYYVGAISSAEGIYDVILDSIELARIS